AELDDGAFCRADRDESYERERERPAEGAKHRSSKSIDVRERERLKRHGPATHSRRHPKRTGGEWQAQSGMRAHAFWVWIVSSPQGTTAQRTYSFHDVGTRVRREHQEQHQPSRSKR